jgi:glycosyltransferase involved in cell wall biosynthesis
MSANTYLADMVDAFVPALQDGDRVTILLGPVTLLPWEPIEHSAVHYLVAHETPGTRAASAELVKLLHASPPNIWWSADTTLQPPKLRTPFQLIYAIEDLRVLLGDPKGSFWKRLRKKRLALQNLIKADAIVCPNKAIATRLIHVLGIPARHKTFVIPNGVPPVFRRHAPEEVVHMRRKLLIPQRYVLMSGASATAEYLTPVLEALGASEEISSITCVILGDAKLPDTLREVIRDCHLEGMIRFLNEAKLEVAEIAALYSGASILFEPSQSIAYLPSILRAMASGTPVVCAASPANEDIYEQAIIRIHPTDAREWISVFTTLTLSTVLRDRQIAKGLNYANEYTSTSMAKRSFAFARLLCALPAATIRKNNLATRS